MESESCRPLLLEPRNLSESRDSNSATPPDSDSNLKLSSPRAYSFDSVAPHHKNCKQSPALPFFKSRCSAGVTGVTGP